MISTPTVSAHTSPLSIVFSHVKKLHDPGRGVHNYRGPAYATRTDDFEPSDTFSIVTPPTCQDPATPVTPAHFISLTRQYHSSSTHMRIIRHAEMMSITYTSRNINPPPPEKKGNMVKATKIFLDPDVLSDPVLLFIRAYRGRLSTLRSWCTEHVFRIKCSSHFHGYRWIKTLQLST